MQLCGCLVYVPPFCSCAAVARYSPLRSFCGSFNICDNVSHPEDLSIPHTHAHTNSHAYTRSPTACMRLEAESKGRVASFNVFLYCEWSCTLTLYIVV